MPPNVTIVNNMVIWPKIATENQERKNAIAAKNMGILQKIAPTETERTHHNVTSVTKSVTLLNNAKVKINFKFRLIKPSNYQQTINKQRGE